MKMRKTWVVAVLVLAVILFLWVNLGFTDKTTDNGDRDLDEFAVCLSDSGLTMYGTEWCSHCQSQKEIFGDSFQYVNYVDCDKDRQACISENIEAYPTWKFNEEVFLGVQSLDKLASLSKCSLSQN